MSRRRDWHEERDGAAIQRSRMATEERDIYRPRGEVLAGISSGIVGLYREHFGKGPTMAKTYVLDDL